MYFKEKREIIEGMVDRKVSTDYWAEVTFRRGRQLALQSWHKCHKLGNVTRCCWGSTRNPDRLKQKGITTASLASHTEGSHKCGLMLFLRARP